VARRGTSALPLQQVSVRSFDAFQVRHDRHHDRTLRLGPRAESAGSQRVRRADARPAGFAVMAEAPRPARTALFHRSRATKLPVPSLRFREQDAIPLRSKHLTQRRGSGLEHAFSSGPRPSCRSWTATPAAWPRGLSRASRGTASPDGSGLQRSTVISYTRQFAERSASFAENPSRSHGTLLDNGTHPVGKVAVRGDASWGPALRPRHHA